MQGNNELLRTYLNEGLRYMDPEIRERLKQYLDPEHGNNWRKLKAVMEDDRTLTNCVGSPIYVYETKGSPTEQLLEIMQIANRKTNHLLTYLDRMRHYQALALFGIIRSGNPNNPSGGGGDGPRNLPRGASKTSPPNQAPCRELPHDYTPRREVDEVQQRSDDVQVAEPIRQSFNVSGLQRERTNYKDYACPPIIRIQSKPGIYLRPGERLELFAEVFGARDYKWFHAAGRDAEAELVKEGLVQDHRVVLEIECVERRDNGWYWCVFENSRGREETLRVRVTVAEARCRETVESLQIDVQPNSQIVPVSGSCRLECHATSTDGAPLRYQWLYYPSTSEVGRRREGGNSNILALDRMEEDDFGDYVCEITTDDGRKMLTRTVKVAVQSSAGPVRYNASDKVALLIGLDAYHSGQTLPAVLQEMIQLSDMFFKMGFKVISAVNMNRNDMRKVLAHFYEMIGPGVYGVVYLAGHGFEKNGRCYLKCYDCTDDPQCPLCIEEVRSELQRRNAALLLLIVDICRSQSRSYGESRSGIMDTLQYMSNASGNMVTIFSTSSGMKAYEEVSKSFSIFSSCLTEFLGNRDPVQHICLRILEKCKQRLLEVRRDMARNERQLQDELRALSGESARAKEITEQLHEIMMWRDMRQVPVIECDTHEYRSLMDEVQGGTELRNQNEIRWTKAANPYSLYEKEHKFETDNMLIILNFESRISNVLDIGVITRAPAEWYGFAEVSPMENLVVTASPVEDLGDWYHCILVVEGLHLLDRDLSVMVKVKLTKDKDLPHAQSRMIGDPIDLGRPLMANLYVQTVEVNSC